MADVTALSTVNFNGTVLMGIMVNLVSIPIKFHVLITAGDDMERCMEVVLERRINMFSMYTPKMIELISTSTFQNSKDLSFVKGVSVFGAPLGPNLYQRIENGFRSKISKNSLFYIQKYIYSRLQFHG